MCPVGPDGRPHEQYAFTHRTQQTRRVTKIAMKTVRIQSLSEIIKNSTRNRLEPEVCPVGRGTVHPSDDVKKKT